MHYSTITNGDYNSDQDKQKNVCMLRQFTWGRYCLVWDLNVEFKLN